MGKKHYFDDGTYFDEEIGEIVDHRNNLQINIPTPRQIHTPPRRRRFSNFLSISFESIRTIFFILLAYLPKILAVLLFILCLFTDSHGSVKFLMIIPCAIIFFTGWKGIIGIAILVGLVQAC